MKSTGEREVATIEGFYTIKETPGIGISPPELRDFRDFIHDPSIGSRCLKEGTLLLYKIEVKDRNNDIYQDVILLTIHISFLQNDGIHYYRRAKVQVFSSYV